MTPRDPGRDWVQALARFADARSSIDAEGSRRLRVGDVFVLEQTAAWPVEWVVVRANRWQASVVPADACPLVGAGDVAVADDAPGGPLTIRCRFPVMLSTRRLAALRRSGVLASESKGKVLASCARLAAGRTPAEDHLEVDSGTEYREWIGDVVLPAHAALAAFAATAPAGAGRWREVVAGLTPRLPLAAAVLLATGLALALLLQARRFGQLEASFEGSNEARPLQALLNPPVAWLYPETDVTRGGQGAIEIEPHGPLVVLILSAVEPGSGTALRLAVARDGGRVVWETDALARNRLGEATVALPRTLLQPGGYTLDLSRLIDGRFERIAQYRLRIRGD